MKYRGASTIMRSWRIDSIAAALIVLGASSPSFAQFSITEFSPWSSYPISAGPMMIGDFNGNGRSDILHVAKNTDHVHVWHSQGNGKFEVKEFSPWPGYAMSGVMLLGDFDGDGKSDVLHALADHANVWTSNGDGTFAVKSFTPWSGYSMAGRMMIGDFNGDKRSDVFHPMDGTDYVYIWISHEGSFKVKAFRPPTSCDMSTGVTLIADFDGDGKSDVFHARAGSDSADIWHSNGDGTFDVQSFSPWPGYLMDTGSWLVGDFNGDGKADLLHVLPGTSGVNVWLSNGHGTFNVVPFLPRPGYLIANGSWLVGDFNHDGYADIVHFGSDGQAHIWLSNGDGTFTVLTFSPQPNYTTTSGQWLTGDFSGDGSSDLLHGVEGTNSVNIWRSVLPSPLTALILVCSLSNTTTLENCDRSNAADVIAVPERFDSPITCMMHGQAYLAGTVLGRQLAPDERVKIICTRRIYAVTDPRPPVPRPPQPARALCDRSSGEIGLWCGR